MPSPFPGMDPYLEAESLWPQFQKELVKSLYQTLLPGLVDRYRARVGQRQYTVEQVLFTSVRQEEHAEEFIEVRQRGEGRLVTLVDVVSPTNKTIPAARQAYLAKRHQAKLGGANLVEVDLVLQGQPLLEFSREGLADLDYAVTVTRAARPDRYEVYSATLHKRLPRFRVPLAGDDRDVQVDLQAVFSETFDRRGFAGKIDYHRPPPTTLRPDDRQWVDELLQQRKLR